MRKSRAVPLTLLAAGALALQTSCDHPTQVRNCVDTENHIVPDNSCAHGGSGGGLGYHYIFGGASGGRNGDSVVGGSLEPAEGARVVSGDTGAVVRGGFGGGEGGEGEGGHGGGEGGHGGGE